MAQKRIAALTLVLALLTADAVSWAQEGKPDAKSAIANAVQALGAGNLKTIEFSGLRLRLRDGRAVQRPLGVAEVQCPNVYARYRF